MCVYVRVCACVFCVRAYLWIVWSVWFHDTKMDGKAALDARTDSKRLFGVVVCKYIFGLKRTLRDRTVACGRQNLVLSGKFQTPKPDMRTGGERDCRAGGLMWEMRRRRIPRRGHCLIMMPLSLRHTHAHTNTHQDVHHRRLARRT